MVFLFILNVNDLLSVNHNLIFPQKFKFDLMTLVNFLKSILFKLTQYNFVSCDRSKK